MCPPVTVGNGRRSGVTKAAVSIHPRAHASSARERGRRRTTLEIVPLVLVEGREKFGRVEPPHLAAHAPAPGDDAGMTAEHEQRPRDRGLADEGRAPGE